MAIKIGLTGNIGAGKSSVSQIFNKLGYSTIDSDQIVKELYAHDTEVQAEVNKLFGTLDKKVIASQIFGQHEVKAKELKLKLENIIHPAVARYWEKWSQERAHEPLLVHEVQLLFEANLENRYDHTLVVVADLDVRIARASARYAGLQKALSEDEIRARDLKQLPQADKIARADFVIENNSNAAELEKQVTDLLKNLNIT
jgi:dephospho-CoA kinase